MINKIIRFFFGSNYRFRFEEEYCHLVDNKLINGIFEPIFSELETPCPYIFEENTPFIEYEISYNILEIKKQIRLLKKICQKNLS